MNTDDNEKMLALAALHSKNNVTRKQVELRYGKPLPATVYTPKYTRSALKGFDINSQRAERRKAKRAKRLAHHK